MEPQTGKCMHRTTIFCILIGIQLGLIFSSAEGERTILGRVGGDIKFACDAPSEIKIMKWVKDGSTICGMRNGQQTQGTSKMRHRSGLYKSNNGGYTLHMRGLQPSDVGEYKCEVEGKEKEIIQLVLLEVTTSSPQYLLVSDTISLTPVSYPPIIQLSITCKNPKNEPKGTLKTTGDPTRDRTLRIENLQLSDSGQWTCRISTGENFLEIPYNITVAGIIQDDSSPMMLYSRINDTVLLTLTFNVNIKDPAISSQLEVQKGGLYRSADPSWQDLEEKTLNISKAGICWSHACGEKSSGVRLSDLSVTLPSVEFTDGGWYTILLKVRQKELQKRFHLTVLRVWASPNGPVAIEGQVDLVCEVSPQPDETVLKWTHINGSHAAEWTRSIGQKSLKITLDMFPEQYGVWRCSLHRGGKQLQSADYEIVMKRNLAFLDWWICAAGGAVALALLLVIICAVVCVARCRRLRQRQARRRAWLMQQRTCQCKDKMKLPLHP